MIMCSSNKTYFDRTNCLIQALCGLFKITNHYRGICRTASPKLCLPPPKNLSLAKIVTPPLDMISNNQTYTENWALKMSRSSNFSRSSQLRCRGFMMLWTSSSLSMSSMIELLLSRMSPTPSLLLSNSMMLSLSNSMMSSLALVSSGDATILDLVPL